MYQKIVALHAQNATDWRAAQGQVIAFRRSLYGSDIKQATVILAILYDNNDYTETL